MYRIWHYDQFASSCICLIDFDTISLYFNPFAIRDIPQHGLAWNKLGIHGRLWPTQTSEIFWTSFFRWWEVGSLVALVEGSVCFGNFGGQDKGQWYLIGPSPDPLQTWGVWYFFILYSGMMWDVFWFLWYFGHQFWGDWCQKSISRRPQFWPRDWYFWINDHGPMSPSIFSHFAVGLFGFSRGEVLMNTDDYWMNVLLLLDWSRLCLCKIENYGQEMNNAKMPNKRTHKHTLTCSDCLVIWAVHSCSNLCWICFKLGYLEAFGGLEGDSIFRELMGFMEITCWKLKLTASPTIKWEPMTRMGMTWHDLLALG